MRNFIGSSVLRLAAPPLITGRGRFAADINFPHQLHMRVVRSTRAHGKILSIDIGLALAHPGVMAVWTSADVRNVPPINLREGRSRGCFSLPRNIAYGAAHQMDRRSARAFDGGQSQCCEAG